jgi:hypothetical protein
VQANYLQKRVCPRSMTSATAFIGIFTWFVFSIAAALILSKRKVTSRPG